MLLSNILLQVCDAIQTGLPVVCNSKFNSTSPATAYAYSKNSCYQLGQLEHDFAYPLDPINSSVGIRLAYNNGEGGNGVWPRAIIYDLYCDTSGAQHKPEFTYEFPRYTYRVTWRTQYACPLVETGQTCSLPKFDSTWDVS
jgi:alpha-L-fucosidase